ncbi:MAG: ornithine cyclodeaminase family protein [Kordiimonas sp.]
MKLISLCDIKSAFDFDTALEAIREAFIAFSDGKVDTPPVGYLGFDNPPGDMHIKYGHIKGDKLFVVKLATGFYDNPKLGLPSSNGLMMVISAETGQPLALLQDEGYLTDMRTAIAGALATSTLAAQTDLSVGIIGTGIQARLQLECLSKIHNIKEASVWGRSTEATQLYLKDMAAKGITVCAMKSPELVCKCSNVIITTTPATTPIIQSNWIKRGTHITAVGADAPGKQELNSDIIKRATMTVCDSKDQCLHHGEMSHLPKTHFTDQNSMELGQLLSKPRQFQRNENDITVADLTGIAAQDIAIAKSIWQSIST